MPTPATGFAKVDLAKLCDVIEAIPPIPPETISSRLRSLRASAELPGDILAPGAPEESRKLDQEFDPQTAEILASFEAHTLLGALVELVRTPRILEHVERSVRALWAKLHGEIDWWDVFLLTVLRHSAQPAFDFIVHHRDRIRRVPDDGPRLGREERKNDDLLDLWRALLADQENGWAIRKVVAALGLRRLSEDPNAGQRPQGIRLMRPVDYLARYLSGQLSPGEIRDQDVLADSLSWRDGTSDRLPQQLASVTEDEPSYLRRWQVFARDMAGLRLLDLADSLVDRLSRVAGPDVLRHLALLGVWTLAHRHRQEYDDRDAWVTSRATGALRTSIHLSNGFYYFWASTSHGLVDYDSRDQVRRAVYDAARSQFANAMPRLEIALANDPPAALGELVFPADSEEPRPSVLRDPKDWSWLASVLLDGAHSNPALFMPQLAYLLGSSSHAIRLEGVKPRVFEKFQIDDAHLTGLFGSKSYDILAILAEVKGSEDESLFTQLREEAQKLLAKSP